MIKVEIRDAPKLLDAGEINSLGASPEELEKCQALPHNKYPPGCQASLVAHAAECHAVIAITESLPTGLANDVREPIAPQHPLPWSERRWQMRNSLIGKGGSRGGFGGARHAASAGLAQTKTGAIYMPWRTPIPGGVREEASRAYGWSWQPWHLGWRSGAVT